MEKYTGNYAYTNHNFTIENIHGYGDTENKYHGIICVIQNILLRGRPNKNSEGEPGQPTIMSKFLQEELKINIDINDPETKNDWFNNIIALVDREEILWEERRKEFNNDNIAFKFFKEIPELIPDFSFIQRLIIPKCKVRDIIDDDRSDLEVVDFYLAQAKLVIDIVEDKKINGQIDYESRDFYLQENGIRLIKIDAYDIKNNTKEYKNKLGEINCYLRDNEKLLSFFRESFNKAREGFTRDEVLRLRATEILRNQITILQLLKNNIISFEDDLWEISLTGNISSDSMSLAIMDILIWTRHLCQLAKLDFKEPKIIINICSSLESLELREGIKIDSNLFKRYSHTRFSNKDVVFVRTYYLDEKNYFKVAVSQPIEYKIINDEAKDMESIEFLLYNIFGFKDFRGGQLNIILNSLRRKDTIGLLPTGSGKSLCYQFVGILQPTISLVVCPIKSLMYDQKENLDKVHISNTNAITSDLRPDARERIMKDFESGKYNFLWISPERFQVQEFRDSLKSLDESMTIGMGVIDEVHCLSEWGHDFRTSYLNLISTLKNHSSNICLLGLTATASSFVLEDLKREFNIGSMDIKTIESYDREELNFHIETIHNSWNLEGSLYSILEKINKELNFKENYSNSVLVFTRTKGGRKGCYSLAKNTSLKLGLEIPFYSGSKPSGLNMTGEEFNNYKFNVQKKYKKDRFPLLFATKAFGMGIDKSNIRATIHCGLPSSLESLYQEAGRAGRDKKEADCYVIYQRDNWHDDLDRDIFFQEDISTEDLKELFAEYSISEQGDILGNFFFYLNSTKGIKSDFKLMKEILDKFASPNVSRIISKENLNKNAEEKVVDNQEEIQKAIYRLKLIGIVDDWLVRQWEFSGRSGAIEVFFSDYNEDSVRSRLVEYISRYIPNFKYEEEYLKVLGGDKYLNLEYKGKGIYEYVEFLLIWIYDNILYNRRKSIYNITTLCEEFVDSKSFKKEIDRYFKFTDETYALDYIAQNPDDINKWYSLLTDYDEKNASTSIIDQERLLDIRGSLMRMFESYRYNQGLDYIDGLSYLLLNNGKLMPEHKDKLKYIHEKNKKTYNYDLLDLSLKIIDMSDIDNREDISEVLCQIYPEEIRNIYNKLKDNYSLNKCILDYKSRLKSINEVVKW